MYIDFVSTKMIVKPFFLKNTNSTNVHWKFPKFTLPTMKALDAKKGNPYLDFPM